MIPGARRCNKKTTRWFIIIDGKAAAVVRCTLDAADVGMLAEALRQVLEDLAPG